MLQNWTLFRLEKELQAYLVLCETENTNENTNLRELADAKKRCRRGHRNRSAVSVIQITVDIGHPNQVNPHRYQSPKLPQNFRFHQTPRSQNGHKTIEVEFRIRVESPLLPRSH